MEMKFGKTGFARCLLQQNAGLVPGSEQVAPAAEPAKSVVVEQLEHVENDTPLQPARPIDRESARPFRLPCLGPAGKLTWKK